VTTVNKIIINFEIVINRNDEKKVEGLLSSTGWDRKGRTYPKSDYKFLGLSERGSPFYAKEINRLSKIIGAKLNNVKSKLITK
jgi:hypothetical protein